MNRQKSTAPDNEYQNFKNLAEKLVAVPKKEVDKEREVYESKKKRESEKKK
jgi:hypothetical protein